jgi:hypothetical protein
MRYLEAPATPVAIRVDQGREENTMGTESTRGVFISLVLTAAMLLAVFEVTAERRGGRAPMHDTSWVSSLRKMDQAMARGDLPAAAAAHREVYRAAIASGTWEGFLAAGDAVVRLGDATRSRGAAEPDARRLYLAALFRAHSQSSLDGVLQATEAFARLGDRQAVAQGLALAVDLAGSEPAAQARVREVAERSSREAVAAAEQWKAGARSAAGDAVEVVW